jgi:quercetin dioxygenase-like cupin family protein
MDIMRNGSQPSGKGPAEWFIGTVLIDPLFKAPDPARVSGASVTFEPGARAVDGKVVEWLEQVSDEQYRGG